jgi:eukaryotic-like serine/threonine-protein kinase
MAVTDTLINTVFDGRYRVLRKLGSGGMANVYLAEDQELGRRVAIKILNERHANDEQFVERFRREAKNAAGLSHPNIVSIYDRGEAEGTYYIAMEYLEGHTLKELIVSRGPLAVNEAIGYARQILAAVRFAHRKGIVHRDIKPHNALVDGDDRLKVTDFGIARAGASQMTEAGSIIGTAQYLSPEQARGASVDERSDLYSVGVVLYELLTGEVPFKGDTPVEIAMRHLSSIPEPPSAKRDEVPPELDMIVLRALAKNPDDRFQTAEEMDAELARAAEGLAVTTETADAATAVLAGAGIVEAAPTMISRTPTRVAPRRPPPPPAPRPPYYYEEPPPRRRPFWPWLLALALLVAAGLAGWYAYTRIQDELKANEPVAVPFVEGQRENLAVANVADEGLKYRVRRLPHQQVREGLVYDQQPDAGERIERANTVTIFVSAGKPRTTVPNVVGRKVADAIAALADKELQANPVDIFSKEPEDTVLAQDPRAGTRVVEGTRVRINVSKGPKPVGVPPVIGDLYENAAAQLQAADFAVARRDVDSDQPRGVVVGQSPGANQLAPPGSRVTLSVSKGPKTSTVPEVTSLDQDTATQTLENSGFRVRAQQQDTTDPSQDGIVLSQEPPGGTQAKPNAKVTIVVGRLVQVPEEAPPR